MQKTYKCKNGHKFKTEEQKIVSCPTCNEHAEPVHWNRVNGEFHKVPFGFGLKKEFGSIIDTLRWK